MYDMSMDFARPDWQSIKLRDSVIDNILVIVKHLNSRYNNKMYLHLTFHVYKEPYS